MGKTTIKFAHTHPEEACANETYCTIHRTSEWAEAIGPQHWRGDRGIMERICKHGVGHYDWDQYEYHKKLGAEFEAVHGCDFCCTEHYAEVVHE